MFRNKIQDIKKGDTFKVNGNLYEAKFDANQNLDELDEPWIVYDTNDNSWFEEDIMDFTVFDMEEFWKEVNESSYFVEHRVFQDGGTVTERVIDVDSLKEIIEELNNKKDGK